MGVDFIYHFIYHIYMGDNFKSYFYQVFLNAGFSELYLTYKNI